MMNYRLGFNMTPLLNRPARVIPRQIIRLDRRLKHRTSKYEPLLEIIKKRKNEAKRSIIVQVKGKSSGEDLYTYCSQHLGPISGMYFYNNQFTKTFSDYYIVEFEDEIGVEAAISSSLHLDQNDSSNHSIPVTSPFLWLSNSTSGSRERVGGSKIPMFSGDTPEPPPGKLTKSMTLAEQIKFMYEARVIPESHTRVRYLLCRQIEVALQGMFHHCSVLPFGSSVNGFGNIYGDQDMVLCMNGFSNQRDSKMEKSESRLVFHTKSSTYGSDRAQVQRFCDQTANLLQAFLPGCQDVLKILNARVPIIKYRQELVGLDCDLCINQSSGILMSSLIYLLGSVDARVRPLVFFVKEWTKSQKLIKDVRPTNYFTNFVVIMLVVCYLQQVHRMLPSVSTLNILGKEEDFYECEEGLQVRFVHNIEPHIATLNQKLHSDIDLFQLLQGFFQFYSEFNFSTKRLNPITGTTEPKDKSWSRSNALDLINPIDDSLNVSYNVTQSAVSQFSQKCREANKRCQDMASKEGNFLITDLLGKPVKDVEFSFPRIADIGLSKKQKNRTIANHKVKKVNAEDVTRDDSDQHNRKSNLRREKIIRTSGQTPYLEQKL